MKKGDSLSQRKEDKIDSQFLLNESLDVDSVNLKR